MNELKIHRMNKVKIGKIVAFFDIIYHSAILKGFKLIQNNDVIFMVCPTDQGKDKKNYEMVMFLDVKEAVEIEKLAKELYNTNKE